MDTLKFTVSRLLLDFEQNEELNNVVRDFDDKKESKSKSLARLLAMLNEKTEENEVSKGKSRMMMDKDQRVESLRADFHSLIDKDKDLSKVFGSQTQSNLLIMNFRDQMLSELLQLVETVLIEQGHGDISPEILQERLS